MKGKNGKEQFTERLAWWVLLKGDRIILTSGVVVGIFLLTRALVRLNVWFPSSDHSEPQAKKRFLSLGASVFKNPLPPLMQALPFSPTSN